MNNKELVSKLSKKIGMSLQETQQMLDKANEMLGKQFSEMDTISVQGFGVFEVKKRQERLTIHPQTGKRLLIPPKMSLGFSASKTFKEKIKDLKNNE